MDGVTVIGARVINYPCLLFLKLPINNHLLLTVPAISTRASWEEEAFVLLWTQADDDNDPIQIMM